MASPSQKTGKAAEDAACRFLESKGLRLIARNFRVPAGEIDLIMQDLDDVVFVEVRTRKSTFFGSAVESVTGPKRQRLLKASRHFLRSRHLHADICCRWDIVGISHGKIEWIKNAFDADG